MDLGDKDKFEIEKRTDDPVNYHSPNLLSDWRFGSANFTNTPMGLVPIGNPMEICKGDLIGSSSCSSAPMVDSVFPPWDHPISSQNLGFYDTNVQNNTITSNTLGIGKVGAMALRTGIDRTLDIGWNPQSSMLKGGLCLPNVSGMLPQSLSQFPTDSGFIERAARFSCFSGGSFGDMVNPFSIPESSSPQLRAGAAMERSQEVWMQSISAVHSQKNELHMVEALKDADLPVERGATEGSPLKNERGDTFVRSHDEAKQGVAESDEAEFSGGGQEEPSRLVVTDGEPSAKGNGSTKRKRSGQETELDQLKGASQYSGEASKDNTEILQKGDQIPSSTTNINTGKHGKQGPQASDPAKDEFIHVRARRGQATNSHSLAERVRREKISERMKFLQDIVPGCSKVTGKAVMLDEIINYVQSLQRQVEFLSMKLATVNPRLDFNIDGLRTKDILQSRASPPSTLGFSPNVNMTHPQLHPSQPGLIQAGLAGMGNSSDTFRRTMNIQLAATSGGYMEPSPLLPSVWEDELHNIVQTGFGPSTPADSQDLNGSMPPGHVKVEL